MAGAPKAGPPRPSALSRRWSTDALPHPEQMPAWREAVSQAFVPVAVRRTGSGPFSSSVRAAEVGPLGVSYLRSEPQEVRRGEREIRRRAGDVFFLNLPLSPGTVARQGGRSAELNPGDFVVVDGSRPFELSFTERFEQISLTLPHDLLAPLLGVPEEVTAVRVPGDRGVGAVAAAAVITLARAADSVDREAALALSDHVAGLIALALAGVRSAPSSSTHRGLLLQAALDEIERSLSDPELSPAVVAARVGISRRYLHRLFAERGPSFGQWVRRRRLERARRALEDPRLAHWTIADIAREHGYTDPSHFTRAFRTHFGATPRAVRRAALSASRAG